MSVAREQFLGRVEAIRSILASPISTDIAPVPVPSSAAVVARNGCMVMLFCALEGFVRDRSLECAKSINQTSVPYAHLPEGLKYASLVSTFEGLLNITRGWPEVDKILEFEQAVVAVASGSLGSPYQFTTYSFARERSNVSVEDIGSIARSFGVSNLWSAMRGVVGKAGMALAGNIDESFRQLAKERHKAAHVPHHNVPHSQLSAALPVATTIALGFDALISTATHRLSNSNIAGGAAPARVTDADVEFITLKPRGAGWAAFRPTRQRAAFVEQDRTAALARAAVMGRTNGLSVVCHDASGRASAWTTVQG